MTESPEHQFLAECITGTLDKFSHIGLYSYAEAERRKFDFACELTRDWTRPLVGQTLWKHVEGVDKDLRSMLFDADAEICAYIARDTIKARRLVSEVVKDFRSGGTDPGLHRLKIFWIPSDFDADQEDQRNTVARLLESSVSRDILMNVLFGNLSSEDVRTFVRASGVPGLHMALLYEIATSQPDMPMKEFSASLGASVGAIRERILRLLGAGFVGQFGGGVFTVSITSKGRVFLDLCSELWSQHQLGRISAEMLQILRLLDMRYAPTAVRSSARSLSLAGPMLTEVPEMVTGRLLATMQVASERWDIDFSHIDHLDLRPGYRAMLRGTEVNRIIEELRKESDDYYKSD